VEAGQVARISLGGGEPDVQTGLPVLDHLVGLLARSGGFELSLELAPDEPEAEVDEAGSAFGRSLAPLLAAPDAKGFGVGTMPADEALATVVLERSDRPLVASNADLSASRVGGLGIDLAARFLNGLVEAAGLVVHVRLIEGTDSQHVLEAIFKALGVALAEACLPRPRPAGGSA
jgi:imidazoleglycerol-phosphate dehydratase